MASEQGNGTAAVVRLSVVLDRSLAEHVRIRAFETRKSRSAYVRELVANDIVQAGGGNGGERDDRTPRS